jgi:Family of unknown function (DUF6931)
MSRVRFATTQALFDAFPDLYQRVEAKPTDAGPIIFLKSLVSAGKLDDAVAFCAYLLPRREAVWWACGCTRALVGDIPRDRATGLLAAEVGMAGDGNNPSTWLALGAGWSSGSLFTLVPAPVPPYMTARCTRIAVLLSAISLKADVRSARLKACIAEGIKLAETGL